MAQPKSPIITFQINLTPNLISLLHPARSQTNQDQAVLDMNQFTNLINTYIPGLLAGENIEQKNGYQFTAYGQKAKYILDTYATDRPGQPAILTVISISSASQLGIDP